MSTGKWKPASTVYRGSRANGAVTIKCNNKVLEAGPSQALHNHSPTGFNWGYSGSGPAQLALGILLDFTRDKNTAMQHYQSFKWAFISRCDWNTFKLTGQQILNWLPTPEQATKMALREYQ